MAPPPTPALWRAADDPGNPFGVPIIDLMANLDMLSTTEDPQLAARSVSWRAGQHSRLSFEPSGETVECELTYAAAHPLPDGMLFVPAAMEDKWVIALQGERIAVARSWTGDTQVVADVRLTPGNLRIIRVTFTERSGLGTFGDPVAIFDWLMRAHALGQRIPLPVSQAGADLLRAVPLSAFAPFGHRAFCAAVDYELPRSERPVRSDGDLIAAVQDTDYARVTEIVRAGDAIGAESTCAGYSALHLAVVKGDLRLVQLLLALGANPNQQADQQRTPLPLAFVHDFQASIADALLSAGAELEAADAKGFCSLHAAAEVGSVAGIRYLKERGADWTAKTNQGLSPLHIACALGYLDAARTLVELGADVDAPSDLGSPLDVAKQEGKSEVIAWLASRGN
jgi:hypothetical protein